MERYFIVTEKSPLHKEWFAYQENKQIIRDLVAEFIKDNGIESDAYFVDERSIYIVPTEKDVETFKGVLGLPVEDNLQKFKANSKIGKAWVKALKDAGLKVKRKPMVILYFKGFGGKYRSRIFDQNGILYCSMDPASGDTPDGFTEIKASEFFKVVEEAA